MTNWNLSRTKKSARLGILLKNSITCKQSWSWRNRRMPTSNTRCSLKRTSITPSFNQSTTLSNSNQLKKAVFILLSPYKRTISICSTWTFTNHWVDQRRPLLKAFRSNQSIRHGLSKTQLSPTYRMCTKQSMAHKAMEKHCHKLQGTSLVLTSKRTTKPSLWVKVDQAHSKKILMNSKDQQTPTFLKIRRNRLRL